MKIRSLFSVVLPLLFLTQVSFAQEEELYSYGTVVTASPTELTIEKYDIETDAETNESFVLDANTKFENNTTVANIKAGDQVDIYYVEKEGKKVATDVITFSQEDLELEEEEETPTPAPAE